MTAPAEDGDRAYVEFTRRLLDDMSAGLDFTAEHYTRLFPACAERIREDLGDAGAPSADTIVRRHPDDDAAEDAGLPDRIGAYEITGELAAGGMGRLLLAKHPERPDPVVIKTAKAALLGSDSKILDRLRREAAILGRLDDDRICPMTDLIIEGDRVFVVMPFIEGSTLEAQLAEATSRMRRGAPSAQAWRAIGPARPATAGQATELPPGLEALVWLMEEVARAIHVAHLKGVVHRDLKPGNIMVRPNGQPVVLDFGLAVDLSDSQSRRLTSYGDVIGTPSHMAPEQIRSESQLIDRRTDVYALGVILYELLTHRRAFKEDDVRKIYKRVLDGDLVPPRAVNPEIPRDLDSVCQMAMDVDRLRRYDTALDFAEDLRRVRARERTIARPVSTARRAIRGIRRHPRLVVGIAGVLVILAVIVVFILA